LLASTFEKAVAWYEDRVRGLGARFLDEIEVCLESIQAAPERYPVIHRDVHRALLKRFPYAVFFVVRDQALTVIACIHTRRHPKHWQRRH